MTRTPVDDDCVSCVGHGRRRPTWTLCPACDGLGRVYAAGAPRFGCAITLAGRPIGQVVTLGNGDVGRVVKHVATGSRPLTYLRLICPIAGVEHQVCTPYPSACGVSVFEAEHWQLTRAGRGRSARHADALDPMRTAL